MFEVQFAQIKEARRNLNRLANRLKQQTKTGIMASAKLSAALARANVELARAVSAHIFDKDDIEDSDFRGEED